MNSLPKPFREEDLANDMLLQAKPDSKERKLLRVIWTRQDAVNAYVLDVSGNIPPGSRAPYSIARTRLIELLAGGVYSVVENHLATYRGASEDALSTFEKATRDQRYLAIESLVHDEASLINTLSPKSRRKAVEEAAAKHNTSCAQIYRILTKYWWFGMGKDSLIPSSATRGGTGKTREYTKKTGRPNAVTVLEGTTKYVGNNVDARDLKLFKKAVHEYWIKKNMSLQRT